LATPREGDLITSGPLLRFIPNWDVVAWEYDRDRPSPRAWRKRANEEYVSFYIEGDNPEYQTSVGALEALKPKFAIFRVTVEALISLGNVEVGYKPLKNEPLGHAHCGAFGINRARAERLARGQVPTERVKGPAASEPPPLSEQSDGPRDLWQGRP
jgi:hypothetical protein